MLSFVKNWLGGKANPIGVDFGSDSLKLAQVARVDNEWRLMAAASTDIPSHARHDVGMRMQFLVGALKDLLAQGNFSGRTAVLALPASAMFIQHLRVPKMDEAALKKALPWEARGKIPIDPSHALLRHHIAGDVYQEQEAKDEIILMAAGRDLINQYLDTAAKAKLDVVGMNVEPKAVIDCFGHIYRRKTDEDTTNCFIDIGCSGTRAVIARSNHMLFARGIPIGGDHFTQAVAASMNIKEEDAKLLRLRLCNLQPAAAEVKPKQTAVIEQSPNAEGFAMLGAALSAAKKEHRIEGTAGGGVAMLEAPADDPQSQLQGVERACREPLHKLIEELDLCRRYYEATFQNRPVDRLVFIGGEAKHRWLCQHIAQELGIAAQVGDPLVRMGRTCEVGPESGIDRRQPQPNWAVAIGLSMGPVKVAAHAE
jgi:type IV pilus assembly protein PilM